MKCPNCGNEILSVSIDKFDCYGSDSMVEQNIKEIDDAYVIETDNNWVGYNLDAEEACKTIECPHCHKFPFDNEVYIEEVVRVICFKKRR